MISIKRVKKRETGQAFVMVLILLLVGALILAPLLGFMGTGLKSGQVFENKTSELYAADAGIEDGLWQIDYDELQLISDPMPYSMYDFRTVWNFELENQVNGKDVTGTIKNIWIPKDLPPPNESDAQAIIGGVAGAPPKLLVTGSIPDTGHYKIRIAFNKEEEDGDLAVNKIGIWLPEGFSYVEGSSNLEQDAYAVYCCEPSVAPHAGGCAVIWDYSMLILAEFPGVQPSDVPMETEVTFEFTSRRAGANPEALAWVDTNFDLHSGVTYTWDADTRVYRLTSQAGNTELEAYTAKSELRELGGAIAGDYRAIGNSLMRNDYGGSHPVIQDTLLDEAVATVDDIPATAEVQAAYLYWSAWLEEELNVGGPGPPVFEDDCHDFSDWNNPGNDWMIRNDTFRGHHLGSANLRYLTLQHDLDLSAYVGQVVTVSWEQWELPGNNLEDSDRLCFAFSSDGGETWGAEIEAFRDDIGDTPQSFSQVVPEEYLTDHFRMYFRIDYFDHNNEYCYIDNIIVSVCKAVFFEDCIDFVNPSVDWDNGADWLINNGTFEGHHRGSSSDRYLTMADSLDFSSYSGKTLSIGWVQWESGDLEDSGGYSDTLHFAFYDGSHWSGDFVAFRGNIGVTPSEFVCPIPDEYLTSGFKLRFYLGGGNGFASGDEYAYIDNIVIFETEGQAWADTSVVFKIDGTQVYFDDKGLPQMGAEEIIASEQTTVENQPGEYSYACYRDVTDIVRAFSAEEDDGNHPGNGTYTVGGVEGDIGNERSYAAWSLIIIYSSPETSGHQIYLYDDFIYSAMDQNVDFDDDGEPGGVISGFLVPEQIEGEGDTNDAAKMTCFVGEGDDYYDYDYFRFTGANGTSLNLSDGKCTNDVWNSWSAGLSEGGIDIDTFYVTWGDGLLEPGDTSATIDLPTATDSWNLVYIILSFRSKTTIGGTLSYLIRG